MQPASQPGLQGLPKIVQGLAARMHPGTLPAAGRLLPPPGGLRSCFGGTLPPADAEIAAEARASVRRAGDRGMEEYPGTTKTGPKPGLGRDVRI